MLAQRHTHPSIHLFIHTFMHLHAYGNQSFPIFMVSCVLVLCCVVVPVIGSADVSSWCPSREFHWPQQGQTLHQVSITDTLAMLRKKCKYCAPQLQSRLLSSSHIFMLSSFHVCMLSPLPEVLLMLLYICIISGRLWKSVSQLQLDLPPLRDNKAPSPQNNPAFSGPTPIFRAASLTCRPSAKNVRANTVVPPSRPQELAHTIGT